MTWERLMRAFRSDMRERLWKSASTRSFWKRAWPLSRDQVCACASLAPCGRARFQKLRVEADFQSLSLISDRKALMSLSQVMSLRLDCQGVSSEFQTQGSILLSH